MLTEQTETGAIHFALEELQAWAGHAADLTQILAKCGVEQHRKVILDRMLAEGLVAQVMPTHGFFLVTLTPAGLQLARHTGGYQGYLDALEAETIQKASQERAAVQATIDGVRANWWAVRVSIAGVLIGAVFSILSQIQSSDTASELAAAKKQITLLQQQVDSLMYNKAKP